MAEIRKGNDPTIRRGPYKGDQLSVDHIIPRSVAPEPDNLVANLELMPQRMNAGKGERVGERQVALARKLNEAGILSTNGLRVSEAISVDARPPRSTRYPRPLRVIPTLGACTLGSRTGLAEQLQEWLQERLEATLEAARVRVVSTKQNEDTMNNRTIFGTAVALLILTATTNRADSGAEHQSAQARPIQLGTSGGNINDRSSLYCCSGTLGALVQDLNGEAYILSNNHVLARVNQGGAGEPVNQPGMIDQNCSPAGAVANLTQFIPIRFAKGRTAPLNEVDAAIARVIDGAVRTDGAILDIGTVSADTAPAVVGLAVQKSGRTTGQTFGTVAAIDGVVDVGYSSTCGGAATQRARFINQIIITPGTFSTGGDSGSVIFETGATPKAVGLLFAGSSSSTIANPMDTVLSALGVSMVGASGPPPSSGSISGTVIDALTQARIAGATVNVDTGESARTDGEGGYSILNVPTGSRTVTTTAAGYTPQSNEAMVSADVATILDFELEAVPVGSQSVVQCVTYNTQGGKNKDRDLLVTVSVLDDVGDPVAGAQVNITLTLNGSPYGNGTGAITSSSGEVTYQLRNAPNGTYVTTVTAVTATGLSFEGSTPANAFAKNGAGSASFCRSTLSGTFAVGEGPDTRRALARARVVKARHSDALMDVEDVVGHALSRNERGEPVIEIYLSKESANARAKIPADLEDVPVRVTVSGPFVAY